MYSVKKQIGDIELFILKDGQTEFGEETFSRTTSSEINSLLTLNNRKAIETNFNAFLVKNGNKNILIDAGAGTLFGPAAGNLSKALEEVGMRNDDITDVIATHLHPDHIGGMVSENGEAVFKNAGLILTKDEHLFWNNADNFKNNINDHKRLVNKTLLYAGVIRTPIPMLTDEVLYDSKYTSLVREVFATTGDIFNVLGDIDFSDHCYIGSDNLQFTLENSLVRLSRLIGLDYDQSDKKNIIQVAYSIKMLFIEKIINNINYIFNGSTDGLIISSIGEGSFLVQDMCKIHKLNYRSMKNENIFNLEDLDKKLVYENLTAALVVKNYFT